MSAIVSTAEWRADLEANGYWSDKPTAVASMRMLLERIESLEKDLLTAHLMVAYDAHDTPGRITSAIRPFLAGVVERHGLDSGRSRDSRPE